MPGASDRASVRPRAREMPPPPPARLAPALARPSAPARRRRPRRARPSRAQDARRGDRGRCRHRWPRPAPGERVGAPPALPRASPPNARADDRSAPARRNRPVRRRRPARPRPARCRAPRPRATPTPDPPAGSAAATRSNSRVEGGSGASRSVKLCSIRPDNAGPSDSPNPPASSAGVKPRGSSSNASGLPRVSATIRSRTRSSSGPVTTVASNSRASRSSSPPTASSGNPSKCRSPLGSRTAKTNPTDSAPRRRATNANACAEASVEPLRVVDDADAAACSSATSESRLRTARPTRNRSGASPSRKPNAVAKRIALRAGKALQRDPGTARTAAATPRTRAPSPTRPRPPGRRRTPTRAAPDTPATRSCQLRHPRAAPAPGSDPRARPPPAHPAPRTRCAGQAAAARKRSVDIATPA